MSRNCFDGNEKSFKFLNPFMDFRTLLIGLNSLKIRGFEMFKKKQSGVHLYIHRSFKFDAQCSFPTTILYANGSTGRFDWCKIIDDNGNIFTIQIGREWNKNNDLDRF